MMVFGRLLFDPLESLNQARFMPAGAGTSPSPEVLCIYWKPGLTSQLVINLPFFLLLWQSLHHWHIHFAIGLICLASDASQLVYLPPLACTFCAYVTTSVHYGHFVST